MKSEFIHLHNHSDNSLLDGAQTINTIINTMDDLNMDSVALTEHGNLFGAISFSKFLIFSTISLCSGFNLSAI